jgi:PhnB protein
MQNKVKAVPDGYHTATPYLIISGAAKALDYYERAFGAKETLRLEHQGKIGHAEFKLGDSIIMLADEYPEMGHRSPKTIGGTPVSIMLYVDDVDTFVDKAVSGGATLRQPVEDKFYGDRSGTIEDPFGHVWHIATHIEDVSPEEIDKRVAAMGKK